MAGLSGRDWEMRIISLGLFRETGLSIRDLYFIKRQGNPVLAMRQKSNSRAY